jgi:hypothetical protein
VCETDNADRGGRQQAWDAHVAVVDHGSVRRAEQHRGSPAPGGTMDDSTWIPSTSEAAAWRELSTVTPAHRHTLASRAVEDVAVPCGSCGHPAWLVYDAGGVDVCERCYVTARDTVHPLVRFEHRRPEWRTIVVVTILAWLVWLAPLGIYIVAEHLLR